MKLREEIKDIREQMRKHKALSTPGILTGSTTGGVTRRPITLTKSQTRQQTGTADLPRWC